MSYLGSYLVYDMAITIVLISPVQTYYRGST
jgi:hypothetical protein